MSTITFDFRHYYRKGERRESDQIAYQWDLGHTAEIYVPVNASYEIHYCFHDYTQTEDYAVESIAAAEDGGYKLTAHIPNKYFERSGELRVYVIGSADDHILTTYEGFITIRGRIKPDDYTDDDPENGAETIIARARRYANESEAWAVGQIEGTDVPSTDPQYNNNSKYYATQAATSASQASTSASQASGSASSASGYASRAADSMNIADQAADAAYEQAQSASSSAQTASTQATKAQSYAVGGTGSRTGESTDNAKYYKEQAEAAVASIDDTLVTKVSEQIDNKFGDDIGDNVTAWLTEHVTPSGSAVVVDDTLTIAGAAADAKQTGDEITGLKSALNKNKEPLNAVWEIGNITTVDGSEVSKNDCVRTPAYPINASKDLIGIFRTDVSVIGAIFINAHFYNGRMNYLGSYKPGDSQIQGSCYIDPIKYGEVAFVRFTKFFINSSDVSVTSNTHDVYITDVTSTDSDLYAAQCKEGYEVVSFHVVKGGITGAGIVYDNDYVARSETGVYFPAGSKIVFLKGYRRYRPRIHFYYPNGRKYEGSYNDTGFITDPDEFDYSVCPDGLYAGLSFNEVHGLTLSEKNYREIENICKIIRPIKKINDSYEERIGGNVVGNQNLLQNGMPFVYEAVYWLNDGIYYKEVTEDTRVWSKDNAMLSVRLKPGEYGFICSFVANEGTGNDGVGYGIWGEDGTEIILYAPRYKDNYEIERSFTISEEQNIYLQFKTYPGESFKVYLYSKPSYLTLRTTSGVIESLNIAEDAQYHNIYDQLVEQTVLKYDAVTNAGNIGYIWISDLHTNSLYPNRNKALKRQLRACAEIANRTNIKFICIGGDILDREVSHDVIFFLINNLFSGVSASRKPIVVLAGNHDDNPYTNPVHLTKSQVKSLFIDMTDVKMIGDVDKCYYYFDEGNYRIICLDMIDYPQDGTYDGMSWWGFSQAQVEWLGDVLKETDKNVILLCHQTLDESHNVWNLGNNGGYTADIRNLIAAYNEKSTVELYGQTYNFTGTTRKVLFVHAGHAHFDEQYYLDSLKAPILVTSCAKETDIELYEGTELVEGNTYRVVTNETGGHWNSLNWTFQFYPNREIGTQSEATFDVVCVGANTVNVFRVGAGIDRSFNLT